jgi:hypothetical protein
MRTSAGAWLTLLSAVLLFVGGCSGGRKPTEPTPRDDNPPPVEGIDPESLRP